MRLRPSSGSGEPFRTDAEAACARTSGGTGGSKRGSPPPGTLVTTGRAGLPAVRPGWRRLALRLPGEPPHPTAVMMSPAGLLGAEFGSDGAAGAAPS